MDELVEEERRAPVLFIGAKRRFHGLSTGEGKKAREAAPSIGKCQARTAKGQLIGSGGFAGHRRASWQPSDGLGWRLGLRRRQGSPRQWRAKPRELCVARELAA